MTNRRVISKSRKQPNANMIIRRRSRAVAVVLNAVAMAKSVSYRYGRRGIVY